MDVAVGDVNGDGKLDILTANTGSDNVSVLVGDGRGGFRDAPGSPFDAGPKPHLLALGDLNNDQKLDLAVTEHDSNDVRVFLGAGEGMFQAAPGSPFAALHATSPHNHGLAVADLNGDGNLDITTSNQNDHSVSVLLGDGRGRFAPAPASPFRVGRAPYPHALGDVNGDGKLDIAVPNVGGNSVSVLLGDGKGGFTDAPGSPYAVTPRPYFVALADVSRDGWLDLLASHDDATLLTVLVNDGRGKFRPAAGSPIDLGVRAWKLALGDFNGDGRLDFATGTTQNSVAVFLDDGRGGFSPAPGSPFRDIPGPWGIAVADVNADGKLDVVVSSSKLNRVTVLLGR